MCDKTIHDLMHEIVEDVKQETDKQAKEMRMNILIKRMINKGLSMAEISNITQLDINEMKKLQYEEQKRNEKYV